MWKQISAGLIGLVLAQALLWSSCETETTLRLPDDNLAEFLLPLSANEPAIFRYDSVTYDPAVGGTARRKASGRWRVRPDNMGLELGDQTRRFSVLVEDSLGKVRSSFPWTWRIVPDSTGITHTIDGIEYLSLTTPLRLRSTWNSLIYTDPSLVISVEGEPVMIHSNWGARIDSLAGYTLPDGRQVEAVWVTHADAENLIELRQVREVYGRGVGLLERHVKILDSQRPANQPFEQRAERGFNLKLIRER